MPAKKKAPLQSLIEEEKRDAQGNGTEEEQQPKVHAGSKRQLSGSRSLSASTEEGAQGAAFLIARRDAGPQGHFYINREEILNKYWALANLDPEATKGNITGQLKALDSLCEELGMMPTAPDAKEERRPREIYRAAWMGARPVAGGSAGG